MSGRPDYDVGDLVVCVEPENPDYALVFTVEAIIKPSSGYGLFWTNWGVVLSGNYSTHPTRAWDVSDFRKLDPRPPEFWTGEIEVTNREGVDA